MDRTIKNQSDQLTYKERDTRIIKHTTKWHWQIRQGITMFQENNAKQYKTKSLHKIGKIKSAFYIWLSKVFENQTENSITHLVLADASRRNDDLAAIKKQ